MRKRERVAIGRELRKLRLARGLTLRAFCLEFKLSPVMWSKLEHGLRSDEEHDWTKHLPAVLRMGRMPEGDQ